MRTEYRAAIFGGIPLGVTLLGFHLTVSPTREWELFFLILAGVMGGLLAYSFYKRSPIQLPLKKSAVVGGVVGLTAGIFYFAISALMLLVVGNRSIVFNSRSTSLAVIGVLQLIVASGSGGLVVGVLSKFRPRTSTVEKH